MFTLQLLSGSSVSLRNPRGSVSMLDVKTLEAILELQDSHPYKLALRKTKLSKQTKSRSKSQKHTL